MLCPDCYDGAPDSPTRGDFAIGDTAREAIAEWNQEFAKAEGIE